MEVQRIMGVVHWTDTILSVG